MSTDNNTLPLCANCGKGEEEIVALKNCVACKMVKYCDVSCQKAHRSQHKKQCRKRAAELHDEALFKDPPQKDDCPICFLRLPSIISGSKYNTCCGKVICSGCIYAVILTTGKNMCPFCRSLAPTSGEETVKRVKKRAEIGDVEAINCLGSYHSKGLKGFPEDWAKALELYRRAAELGNASSYHNIGHAYLDGRGVERGERKATHYWELAAIGGDVRARHDLGVFECINAGNINKALKHFMIAVGSGSNESLKKIKQLYLDGYATKDDYAKALKAYQTYQSEIKSVQRDKAAAYDQLFKYYE